MSDTKQSDVLMYFVQKGETKGIAAESQSTLTGADDLLMDGFAVGRFFTADTFTFGVTLADDEGENLTNPAEGRSYARWRGLKIHEPTPTPPFRAEPDDISITRQIDSSSPVLLNHCLESKPFSTAVIVKRSRIGTSGLLSAILRLEFTTVWIKAIEWEDNDAVMETLKFKFNAVKATYIKRKPDGTVASQWPCGWTSPLTGA